MRTSTLHPVEVWNGNGTLFEKVKPWKAYAWTALYQLVFQPEKKTEKCRSVFNDAPACMQPLFHRSETDTQSHTHAHSSRESYYWQEATSKIEIRTTDSRFCLRPRGLLFSGACIQNACVRCYSGACIQAFQCVIVSFLAKGRRWFSSGTAFDRWRA